MKSIFELLDFTQSVSLLALSPEVPSLEFFANESSLMRSRKWTVSQDIEVGDGFSFLKA
jgi:hypothetical protein